MGDKSLVAAAAAKEISYDACGLKVDRFTFHSVEVISCSVLRVIKL